MSGIFQIYTMHILSESESFGNLPGIYRAWIIPLLVNRPMSLLQQIPKKYHDHDDVHIKLAQCTARKESKFISNLEYLGYICKIIRSKLISFEFSS